ncbi:hypothetical protein [Cryobacterium sp. M23]|uniref:hypothetical protein n=1 Tax=Cryobacterium sp. M23 TaxID=2048292 RepID=UPI0011B05879|nr:hypothetical protein [Cryobacterium sp. M23]
MGVSPLTHRVLAPVTGALVAAAAGWQAAAGPTGFAIALIAICGSLVALLNSTVRALAPFTFGVLFILSSSTAFTVSPATSVLFRILGISLLCLCSLQRPSNVTGVPPDSKRNFAELRVWLPWVVGSLLAFLLLGFAFHGQAANFIFYGIGLVMLALAVVATAVAVPRRIVTIALVLALGITVVGSLISGLVIPEVAIAGGRLRGLTSNANLLGFYAFLLGSLAIVVIRHIGLKMVILALAGVCVVWTSSRGSALALAILLIFLVMKKLTATGFLVMTGLLALGFIVALALPQSLSVLDGLLRVTYSRAETFEIAIELFRSSPLIGIGVGNEEVEIASSPMRALATAGVGGLIAVIVMWVALLSYSRKAGLLGVGFTLAAVVHSFFEGWLLSPTSPLLIVFVLVWWVVVRHDTQVTSVHRDRRITPVENSTTSGKHTGGWIPSTM